MGKKSFANVVCINDFFFFFLCDYCFRQIVERTREYNVSILMVNPKLLISGINYFLLLFYSFRTILLLYYFRLYDFNKTTNIHACYSNFYGNNIIYIHHIITTPSLKMAETVPRSGEVHHHGRTDGNVVLVF